MLTPTGYAVRFFAALGVFLGIAAGLFTAHLGRAWWPHHYNREVLIAKRHIAATAPRPVLWLQGGSATWFGYDEDLLAQSTGYHVVNLGFHAAFPTDFLFREIETYAKPGDMVVISLEPAVFFRQHYTTYAAEELTAWEPSFLQQLPLSRLPDFLRSIEWQKILAGDISRLGHFVVGPTHLDYLPTAQVIDRLEQHWAGTYHGEIPAYYNYLDLDRHGGINHSSAPSWRGVSGYGLDSPGPLAARVRDDVVQLSQWCATHHVGLRYAWVAMARNPGLDLQAPAVRRNLVAISALLDACHIPQLNTAEEAVLPIGMFYDTDHHLTPAGATERTRALLPRLPAAPQS